MRSIALVIVVLTLLVAPTLGDKRGKGEGEGESHSSDGEGAAKQLKRTVKQKQRVRNVYQSVIWPTSATVITTGQSPPNTFANNVRGRVNPVGEFDGLLHASEYFYGLAGPIPPQPTTGRIRVKNIYYHWIEGGSNIISYQLELLFGYFDLPLPDFNVTQFGHFAFDKNDLICGFEVHFRHLALTFDLPVAFRPSFVDQLCQGIQFSCQGSNQVYADAPACVNFMNSIGYGTWDEADQNSITCRQLHSLLAAFDPVEHCPHVSPSGGGKCVDKPASHYELVDYMACRDRKLG